jgi:hypothetical protein
MLCNVVAEMNEDISTVKTRQKESFTSHGTALSNVILIHHDTTKNLTSLKPYAQRDNFEHSSC